MCNINMIGLTIFLAAFGCGVGLILFRWAVGEIGLWRERLLCEAVCRAWTNMGPYRDRQDEMLNIIEQQRKEFGERLNVGVSELHDKINELDSEVDRCRPQNKKK